ncbi:MAG: MarR family transcriptional regulator [Lachnospiraceae bacterium]|nr:MarR family transcriptional regulator [Lachnospiraceae bacterium]
METYDTFNAIVKSLFRDVMDLEGRAILTGEFQNITNNDMHVMEAIGMEKPKNMSSVAKELSVTVGTLTIAVNSLVKKGYVKRNRSERDRRVVYISLTELGERAYLHHEQFHKDMVAAMVTKIPVEQMEVLMMGLRNLEDFFRKYQEL